MKTMICCHCAEDAGKAVDEDPHGHRHAGHLGRGGEEGRHGRRRALVDVGRPHVERHGRDLEGDAGGDEDEAEDDADAGLALQRRGDGGERDAAGKAVDQRGAVEQHAGGERAEDEVFQARLRRLAGRRDRRRR